MLCRSFDSYVSLVLHHVVVECVFDPHTIAVASSMQRLGHPDEAADPHHDEPHWNQPVPNRVLHSPREALRSRFFVLNEIVSIIVNVFLNAGIGYGTLKQWDNIGLWEQPNTENPAPTGYAVDLVNTGFLVVWFTSLLATPGVRNAVRRGNATPVKPDSLERGIYRWFPCRVENVWARATLMALLFEFIFIAPSLVILGLACRFGWMSGANGDEVCQFSKVAPSFRAAAWSHAVQVNFVWFKGLWCGLLAGFAYPFLMLGAMNRNVIPEFIYDSFLENLKLKGMLL